MLIGVRPCGFPRFRFTACHPFDRLRLGPDPGAGVDCREPCGAGRDIPSRRSRQGRDSSGSPARLPRPRRSIAERFDPPVAQTSARGSQDRAFERSQRRRDVGRPRRGRRQRDVEIPQRFRRYGCADRGLVPGDGALPDPPRMRTRNLDCPTFFIPPDAATASLLSPGWLTLRRQTVCLLSAGVAQWTGCPVLDDLHGAGISPIRPTRSAGSPPSREWQAAREEMQLSSLATFFTDHCE